MLTFKSTSLFTRSTFLFSTLVLGLFSMQSNAEQKQVFGEYEVHYIGLSLSLIHI